MRSKQGLSGTFPAFKGVSQKLLAGLLIAALTSAALPQPAYAFTTWSARFADALTRIMTPQEGAGYVSAPVHDWITEVLKKNHGFNTSAYDEIAWQMAYQDIPGSAAFLSATNHFDDNKINENVLVVENRKREIDALLPEVATDAAKRAKFYELFGQILHAMQDFYSHANYVELSIRNNANIRKVEDIPLMDWVNRPAGLKTGYFYWEGFTDWEKFSTLPTCISGLKRHAEFSNVNFRAPKEYCTFMECTAATQAAQFFDADAWVTDPSDYKSFNDAIANATGSKAELHFYLNKDDWDTPMGAQVHPASGKKLYDFARSLAERETERQWKEIENKVKTLWGADVNSANKVLLAIKTNTTQLVPAPAATSGESTNALWSLSKTALFPNENFQLRGPQMTTSARAVITVPAATRHTWDASMNAALKVDSYQGAPRALKAPVQGGAYEVRVYRYQSAEDAALPFTVAVSVPPQTTPPQQTVLQWSLSKTQLIGGEKYTLRYTPPPTSAQRFTYPVAILGTGAPHGNYYQTEGFAAQRIPQLSFNNGLSVELIAPNYPGAYHLRVYDPVTKNELSTLPFTIVGSVPQPPPQQVPPQTEPPQAEPSVDIRNLPRANCGMMGDDGAIPGKNWAGSWSTTNGYMRLIRVAPGVVEGPSTGSGYFKGTEQGDVLTGVFADDTGEYNPGHFTYTQSQAGRCLKGTFIYDEDGGVNEVIGYRTTRDDRSYWDIYERTESTEHLKQMVGGVLSLDQVDGPDDITGGGSGTGSRTAARTSVSAIPQPAPPTQQQNPQYPPQRNPYPQQTASANGLLQLEKSVFEPGEYMQVHVMSCGGCTDRAWVGVVPPEAPHGNAAIDFAASSSFEWVTDQGQGVYELRAPDEPGEYEVRLNTSDEDGVEVSFVRFSVR